MLTSRISSKVINKGRSEWNIIIHDFLRNSRQTFQEDKILRCRCFSNDIDFRIEFDQCLFTSKIILGRIWQKSLEKYHWTRLMKNDADNKRKIMASWKNRKSWLKPLHREKSLDSIKNSIRRNNRSFSRYEGGKASLFLSRIDPISRLLSNSSSRVEKTWKQC